MEKLIKAIKSVLSKYKDPSNRFYTIKNYRIKSQIFMILNVSMVLGLTQNCTNQMRVLQPNELSSSLPVIYLVTQMPEILGTETQTVVFDVSSEQSLQSATCQLNQEQAFDCTSKVISLSNLNDGDHTLKIGATDVAGYEAQPLSVVFRVDRRKPVVTFLQSPSGTVGSTSATITFSATDNLSGIDRIECSLDNVAFARCTSPVSLSNLAVGAHNFRVRAYDRAKNVSDIITASWTINTSAPVLNITSSPTGVTTSKTASFAFSGTVSGVAMTEFECRLDSGSFAACTSGQAYSSLAEGTRTFSVRGRVAGGTMSAAVSASWVVDSIAPTTPIITGNVSAQTQSKSASFNFTATDATSGVASYQCSLDTGTFANCTSPQVYTNLADGTRTFRVRATDQAGNQSVVATSSWVIDSIAPVLAFTQTPPSSTSTAASFTFTVSDAGVGLQTTQCSLDNAAFANCVSPVSLASLAIGTHSYRVQATDRVGNTQTISHSWSVTSDTPPPTGGDYPLIFVTSVPGVSFQHQLNTFGNHSTSVRDTAPGGDLFIRYPDGTLRNLTREAGFGVQTGQLQGDTGIAVREPTVHWSGSKVIFSMAIGGTPARYQQTSGRRWQIYEATGLNKGETVRITKLTGQPSNYNNVSPIYGTTDDIFFTSDAPLFGMTHTYPQLDEYESSSTVTGIWRLNPATNKLVQIQHSPSGSFSLFMDSSGRIIFTRWDHLKRDQQADHDRNGRTYGSFDFKDESPTATKFVSPQQDAQGRYIADERGVLYDQFPEARDPRDRSRRANENFHDFNKFTPWMIDEDGSEEEIVNHAGRDELFRDYRPRAFNDDPNLQETMTNFAANKMILGGDGGFLNFKEDVNRPGYFLGVFGLEFARQSSGRVIEIKMDPSVNPEDMILTDYTNASIDSDPYGDRPRTPSQTGHYRTPLRLSDGTILVSHTDEYRINSDEGTASNHKPRYVFLLKKMIKNPNGTDMIAGSSLTGGIVKEVRWWQDEAAHHIYNGPLNETDVVELRPRTRPPTRHTPIAAVEKTVMQEQGVDEAQFKDWLKRNNLAVMVSRNVTIRDRADISQPFNLRVPAGVSNIPKTGKVYDITNLQIFQADLTRAYTQILNGSGRRVYAKPIHNSAQHKNMETFFGNNKGMVTVAPDGSTAAIVPAGRALTWQLTAPDDAPVVRERYWITFAPGEVRTCASCHGLNKLSHNNLPEPTNKPEAFRQLLNNWKNNGWWQIEP